MRDVWGRNCASLIETEINPGHFSLAQVNPFRSVTLRGREISEDLRKRVVTAHLSGESYKII